MFRKSITIAALALALPSTALAIPNGGGGTTPPPPPPPTARFTISPNPAVVSTNPAVEKARTVPARPVLYGSGDVVKFDASTSTAAAGIDSYEWDLGTGSYVDGDKVMSKRFYATGDYTIRLEVIDQNGHGAFKTEILKVRRAPHAALSADNPAVLVGQTVTYNASASTGDPGLTGNYEWDLDGDGTFEKTTTTPTVATSYSTLGTRTVHVRVTDTNGWTSTAAFNEVVHRAPTAAFTVDPNPATTGQQVTFDGSSSTDDDPIAKYEWDLDGDGTFETDTQAVATTTKTFATAGTYTVRLRVTDDHGVQDVVSHTVTVNDPTTTGSSTTDTTAPKMRISPRNAKLAKNGTVTLKVTCPKDEVTCTGTLRLAKVGKATFQAAGGQAAKVRLHVSKALRRAIRHGKRLHTTATATATDAAGNTGTSTAKVTVHR
jgi:hypothetical protein